MFALPIVAAILLTSFRDSMPKYKVKTRYQLRKITWDALNHFDENHTDTFYYKPDGTQDYKAKGVTTREERSGNTDKSYSYNKSGKLFASSITFSNQEGLVDSSVDWNKSLGTFWNNFFYDKSGQLVKKVQHSDQPPHAVFEEKWKEGNLIEKSTHFPFHTDTIVQMNATSGEKEQVILRYDDDFMHYEYFNDKLNMPDAENLGYKKSNDFSKNLLKITVQLSDKGDTLDIHNYFYRFDDKNRVISVVQINRKANEYDSTAYTYY